MYSDNTVIRLLYSIVYGASIIRLLMATVRKSSSTSLNVSEYCQQEVAWEVNRLRPAY